MEYKNEEMIIRKVRINDDFKSIAELIYETDPYIYPYWFHYDKEECKKVLPPLMKEEGFFYNYKNMYIAIDKKTNEIMGLVSIVTPETNINYDYTYLSNISDSYKYTIDNYIMELINEVKETNLPYFTNVAVSPKHRGKKVSKYLMQYVINNIKERYPIFITDVLSENPVAINLYKSLGFEFTSDEVMGIGAGPNHQVGQYSIELNLNKNKKR